MKVKLSERNNFQFYLLFFTAVFFVDQFSKYIAVQYFSIICNRGVAFGLGQSGLLFSLMALLVVLFLFTREKNNLQKWSLALIIGAGCSNLLDRFLYGCVRDFINIGIIPTFNFADFVITIGVILFFINVMRKNASDA